MRSGYGGGVAVAREVARICPRGWAGYPLPMTDCRSSWNATRSPAGDGCPGPTRLRLDTESGCLRFGWRAAVGSDGKGIASRGGDWQVLSDELTGGFLPCSGAGCNAGTHGYPVAAVLSMREEHRQGCLGTLGNAEALGRAPAHSSCRTLAAVPTVDGDGVGRVGRYPVVNRQRWFATRVDCRQT